MSQGVASPSRMNIGQVLAERYRIDRVIGHGGMGDIYLGTDLELNREVAIKNLKRELIELDGDVVDRFLREGEIQQTLKHPSVVKVYDSFSYNNDYFIVMDYVSGGTLSTLLKNEHREGMPIEQALDISVQLAGALQLAHEIQDAPMLLICIQDSQKSFLPVTTRQH